MKKLILVLAAAFICLAANAQYTKNAEYDSVMNKASNAGIGYYQTSEPSFNGGGPAEFSKWVNSKLRYPSQARRLGIQGIVKVRFTVDYEGNVGDITVVRSVEESLDKEAVRVISKSPRWTPGYQDGEPCNYVMTLPVVFMIER